MVFASRPMYRERVGIDTGIESELIKPDSGPSPRL